MQSINTLKDRIIIAISLRIKPLKRRTPAERLKARISYRKNRSKIRVQRRRYLRTHRSVLKHRKMFMRYKPTWFKKIRHTTPKKPQAPKKFKLIVPKIKKTRKTVHIPH